MKKSVFAVLLLVISFTGYSQINFGLKAGYNSSLTLANAGDIADGTYSMLNVKNEIWNNFQAGVFARVNIKSFYLQPEVLYSIQNRNYQINFKDAVNNDVTVDKFVKFSTVDIPVLVGWKALDFDFANLRLFAGPIFRMDAGSTLEYENLVTSGAVTKDDLLSDFKESTIGAAVGVGVDVLMFSLDARMDLVDNISETSLNDAQKTLIPSLNNSTFIISLGWKF